MIKFLHNKLLVSIIIISIIFVVMYNISKYVNYFEYISFPENEINSEKLDGKNAKKNILLLNTEEYFIGGGEIHTIKLYKNLLTEGYKVSLLVAKDSKLEHEIIKLKLPYYAYRKFRIFKNVFQPALYHSIYNIVKEDKIDIIHSNIEREVAVMKKIAKKLPVKIVATRHVPYSVKKRHTKNLDGIIGVSPEITANLKKENFSQKFNIQTIDFIPPFFEDEKFINFKTNETAKVFFMKNFDINIRDNVPTICTVATINDNKNQALLLKAASNLIHKKNTPLQIILVGTGQIKEMKALAESLKIQEFVFFTGFTDKIPDILYHVDIKILPSKQEAFPITLMEAALMKKALIGSTKTGMLNIIKNNKTGLLFENNNLDSLVEKIETLLNNKELQKTLGENAYQHVLNNFSTKASMLKLEQFYEKILNS